MEEGVRWRIREEQLNKRSDPGVDFTIIQGCPHAESDNCQLIAQKLDKDFHQNPLCQIVEDGAIEPEVQMCSLRKVFREDEVQRGTTRSRETFEPSLTSLLRPGPRDPASGRRRTLGTGDPAGQLRGVAQGRSVPSQIGRKCCSLEDDLPFKENSVELTLAASPSTGSTTSPTSSKRLRPMACSWRFPSTEERGQDSTSLTSEEGKPSILAVQPLSTAFSTETEKRRRRTKRRTKLRSWQFSLLLSFHGDGYRRSLSAKELKGADRKGRY
ncbi:unnamed protein product [Cyprideis torosa]|uniref:Uncharacterized protein n=1 Tax=Cyprideis torosa TaxID=163714 RepID=A0A7R8WH22_9CRUS|nr:unnamed protein product [Cyprideis torosa]CAG0892761.1 unnamed protein product [Cyprideis torosa]